MMTHRINKAILCGNAGKDGEVSVVGDNKSVGRVSIATEDGYFDKNKNEFVSVTNWHNIEGWGFVAEKIEKIKKGDSVLVTGSISNDNYEKDGETKYITKIKVQKSSDISIVPNESQNNNAPDSGVESSEGGDDLPF